MQTRPGRRGSSRRGRPCPDQLGREPGPRRPRRCRRRLGGLERGLGLGAQPSEPSSTMAFRAHRSRTQWTKTCVLPSAVGVSPPMMECGALKSSLRLDAGNARTGGPGRDAPIGQRQTLLARQVGDGLPRPVLRLACRGQAGRWGRRKLRRRRLRLVGRGYLDLLDPTDPHDCFDSRTSIRRPGRAVRRRLGVRALEPA